MLNILDLEKKSSAVTLSDMEIFVFPELMFSLVLANIMSPIIWEWKNDPWFKNIERKSPYKRMLRVKQFIMDNYIFNLDLETWGLTTQEAELERFKDIIDTKELAESNALFGYHGDEYYFDIGIRSHFGLDKYDTNVIPYWKTETVEAMTAFKLKEDYTTGAGECVSLAALYAAALFIVGQIPLKDIYLMATPLHSQNFVDVRDGILTNNRRLVTKNMWTNGTELSAKARRALENEQITIVAHETGHIHTLYEEATIDQEHLTRFEEKISSFTQTELTPLILGNFLRHERELHKCFQIRWNFHNHDYYLKAERLFSYEENSPHMFNSPNRDRLLEEIDIDEYHSSEMPGRIIINDIEDLISEKKISLKAPEHKEILRKSFEGSCFDAKKAIESLISFCLVKPRFPKKQEKSFSVNKTPLEITPEMTRDAIITRLQDIRNENSTAELAFYAYRDLNSIDMQPFIYAALTRNPVSKEACRDMNASEIYKKISAMKNESIYPGKSRLSQPDEVWNFATGDGLEKAILMANCLCGRNTDQPEKVVITGTDVMLKTASCEYAFTTNKEINTELIELTCPKITEQAALS